MATRSRITKKEKAKLDFLYGDSWKKNPTMYIASLRNSEVVRHCEYCGASMTASDVNDYGSLCERCYMREYYNE